jgi:hypothetical protein
MSNHFSAAMLKFPADDARLDRILPFDVTAARLRDEHLIADLTVVEIADGPHNVGWTHADEVNSAMLSFLGSEVGARAA